MPLRAENGTVPPDELRRFDVREWLDPDEPVPAAVRRDVEGGDVSAKRSWRLARARQRHAAACAAWTAASGLPVDRPAEGESWARFHQRVGPPPPGSATGMRAQLG